MKHYKDKAIVAIITLAAGVLFILTIIFAGKQGVNSGMGVWRLSLRFLIFFWMISIYDAVVLDWWMFTKTDINKEKESLLLMEMTAAIID